MVERLTAAVADERQRRVAGGLRAAGVAPGDRVAMVARPGTAVLVCVLGALRTGIVPVMIHSGLLAHERAAILADAEPALVVDDATLARLAEGSPVELAPWPLARPMHYTSGTTGVPKGVYSGILDEDEARLLFEDEADLWSFDASDVHLVCSPLHHSVSIRFAGGTLLRGGTVLVPERFDAVEAARLIADERPNTTFVVPAHLQRLFALEDLPNLSGFRLVAHAGAPCPAPLKHRAIEAFGPEAVWEFCGATEGQFTVCSAPEWLDRPGSVGRARPGRSLSVDPDGTIWCEAPSFGRFSYWRDPAKTAAAWRPATPGSWGAFSVGDLGRLDDGGYLYLDGRRDDLVITGGVNVYPAEVEQTLAQAPGVEQVAVFGVADERWGQRVCAAVVGSVVPAELDRYARGHLAAHKRPKTTYLLDELPHTPTGKLKRSALPAAVGLEGGGG